MRWDMTLSTVESAVCFSSQRGVRTWKRTSFESGLWCPRRSAVSRRGLSRSQENRDVLLSLAIPSARGPGITRAKDDIPSWSVFFRLGSRFTLPLDDGQSWRRTRSSWRSDIQSIPTVGEGRKVQVKSDGRGLHMFWQLSRGRGGRDRG